MKKEQKNVTNKLYDFDYEAGENKKSKRKKAEKKSASIKNVKSGQESDRKKYDDEIIIGVTRLPEEKNRNEKEEERKNNQQKKEIYNRKQKIKPIANKKSKEKVHKTKSNKKAKKIIKIILLIAIIIGAIIFALLSPMFNIQKIEVSGNKQVPTEEIISLSRIEINENIFKVVNTKAAKNIQENAYINSVEIHKSLPGTIKIEITERQPKYMLEYGNGYVYVSNQGYMLEISSLKKDLPILVGGSTIKEDYKNGNRLNEEDLIKLGTVIKIMNEAETNGIANLITKIDISNSSNYTLYLESENKVAYLGDCSNLETRMLFLVGILNKEKGNPGEVFINMNLNTDNAYFRESV